MFDERFFTDTYDLYRPTVTTADSGAQSIVEPDLATARGRKCRYLPAPGGWRMGQGGPDVDYDAAMLIPASDSLRPEQKGDQPDYVEIDGRRFVVMVCWDAANLGLYRNVLLKERRP